MKMVTSLFVPALLIGFVRPFTLYADKNNFT